MATIPNQGSELRHVRKTVTLDGSANNGALGDTITVFTSTGRVLIEHMTIYCTQALVCAADAATSLGIGRINDGSAFTGGRSGNKTIDLFFGTGWWDPYSGTPGNGFQEITNYSSGAQFAVATGDGIALAVIDEGGGANVTAGAFIIDAWYRPITDDGALAGDDIDEDLKTNIWSKALSDISSVPAITASAKDALNWLFALARNKLTQTATTQTLKKDDGTTTVGTASVSDDGTTFQRGEWT